MLDFYGLEKADMAALCSKAGYSPVHAGKIMSIAYKKLHATPWREGSLPPALGEELAATVRIVEPTVAKELESTYDGSVKFLLELADGEYVEAVLMPEKSRLTLCISSQVGCRQACTFCHTGRMGLKRNLTASEIVAQVMVANRWLAGHPAWLAAQRLPAVLRVSNIVFMGMGEPFDNVDEVMKAFAVLTEPMGLNLAQKKISVSTAGHLDGLRTFVRHFPRASLALSLHATTDGERSRLMPINRRWPLSEVLGFFRHHYSVTNPKGWFLVQYTVIAGVNDSLEHAGRLSDLLKGLPVKLNLIPLNSVDHLRFAAPAPEGLHRFRDALHFAGIRVMIRYSKGQDIAAACGQLVHGLA